MSKAEPLKGVRFGKYIGPTGRTRDLYSTVGQNYYKERVGSRFAYGRQGLREAKQSIRKQTKKRIWLKFGTINKTKGRNVK